MRHTAIAALAIGIWIIFTVDACGHPEKRVIQRSGTANAQGTQESKQKQDAATNEVAATQQQIEAKKLKCAKAQKSQDIEIERRLVKYTKWLVIVGAIQFLALIAQGVVFWLTLGQMKDSSQRQLRAYVCLDSGILKFFGPGNFEAYIATKNCGQTPAYDVRQSMHITVGQYPMKVPAPDQPREFPMSVGIIPPGGEHSMIGRSSIPASTPTGPGTIQATVYVSGKIRYRDAFGKNWHTDYRLIYGGPEGARTELDATGSSIGRLQPDAEGNDAT